MEPQGVSDWQTVTAEAGVRLWLWPVGCPGSHWAAGNGGVFSAEEAGDSSRKVQVSGVCLAGGRLPCVLESELKMEGPFDTGTVARCGRGTWSGLLLVT